MRNPYDTLSLEALAGFYYYFNIYIEQGILSKAMYHEIQLIERTAFRKGIALESLYYTGSMMK